MKMSNMLYRMATVTDKEERPSREQVAAQTVLRNKLVKAAAHDKKVGMIVNTSDIEGKGFNLRGWLGSEGFTLINRPQKRILILWNC